MYRVLARFHLTSWNLSFREHQEWDCCPRKDEWRAQGAPAQTAQCPHW